MEFEKEIISCVNLIGSFWKTGVMKKECRQQARK